MKQILFSFGVLCMLLVGCSKSPDKIVAEVYDNAKQQQYGKIANLILPDSITPLTEDEMARFEEMMKSAMGYAEYTDVSVDSVTVNPEGTEAKFVVSTKFADGKSYTERGTLRKTASDRWRLLASREVSDTTDVFSISNEYKHTTELMRNLDFAMSNFLSTRGIPQYQVRYADYLYEGIMTMADTKMAFELYENAADKEYVTAYLRLGRAYLRGRGVMKDLEKSFEWFLRAAETGENTYIYQTVGYAYQHGEGTMKDYEKAIEWFKKGMDANDPNSFNSMAVMYERGQGVEKDLEKSYELTLKAYELAQKDKEYESVYIGLLESNLGRQFEYGKGVEKDINKALEYYKKSAEHGYKYGMTALADVYYYGTDGTPKDYDKAFYWYQKAANKDENYTYAVGQVAECYEYGRGVEMNKNKAKKMYWNLYHEHNVAWARGAALRVGR